MRVLAALVSSLYLSSTTMFNAVQPHAGALLVSGSVGQPYACVSLTVTETPFRAGRPIRRSCTQPLTKLTPTVSFLHHSLNAVVRVAGRIVMQYSDASDTRPESTIGGGSLWLYDVLTTKGPEVVRLSATTGRVQETVRMPQLYRPLLAADDDGLWLVAATNGGMSTAGAAPLFHLAPGSRQAVLVHSQGRAALWITAHAHTVWFESIGGTQNAALWRVDGERVRLLTRPKHPFEAGATYAAGSLWAVAWADQCNRVLVLKIDPRTGARTTVASVPSLDQCGGAFYDNDSPLVFTNGALFFLNGPKLYRVRP